jgi:hypothetical protein
MSIKPKVALSQDFLLNLARLPAVVQGKVLRRFLKKNVLIQDVGVGLIIMSYLGKFGSRFKRASTACIAALPSETPFWYIL